MEEKYEIHVKGGFSERKGLKHFSDIVQINDLNERTRNKIYSAIKDNFDSWKIEYGLSRNFEFDWKYRFIEYLYKEIFSKTERDIPSYKTYDNTFDLIHNIINNYEYTDIFTFIEGIIEFLELGDNYINQIYCYNKSNYKNIFINDISYVFQTENVNYTIINNQITDIIDKEQIKSINETLENEYSVVTEHYTKAIEQLYSVRDYDNSIKESISSVESICQIITQNNKATLGEALKLLKDKIHPALKGAFDKLYGYASDANGIRHANGLGEGSSTFEEAKYMLISSSAFVNYLKENFKKEE